MSAWKDLNFGSVSVKFQSLKTISKNISNRVNARYSGLEICKLYMLPQNMIKYSLPFYEQFWYCGSKLYGTTS